VRVLGGDWGDAASGMEVSMHIPAFAGQAPAGSPGDLETEPCGEQFAAVRYAPAPAVALRETLRPADLPE
jgi:hypothetical protein